MIDKLINLNFKQFLIKVFSNKLINDSFWSLVGNALGKGLALVCGIFVARFLGSELFGEYSLVRNTLISFGVFASMGFGYSSTSFIASMKNTNSDKLNNLVTYFYKNTLYFSVGLSFLLFIFSDLIAINFLKSENLSFMIKILCFLVILNGLVTTQIGILSGFGKFKEIARINIIIGLATFLLSVSLSYFFLLNGALIALFIVQLANFILNDKVIKVELKSFKKEVERDVDLEKSIYLFTLPIALQEGLYAFFSWISYFLIVYYSSFSELGVFNILIQWNSVILFIPGILRNVALNHLSKSKETKEGHNSLLKKIMVINAITTFIPFLIILLLSNLISSSYGNDYSALKYLLSISVFSTIFISVSNALVQAFISLGLNWIILCFRVLREICIIILFFLFVLYFDYKPVEAMTFSILIINVFFLISIYIYYSAKLKKIVI